MAVESLSIFPDAPLLSELGCHHEAPISEMLWREKHVHVCASVGELCACPGCAVGEGRVSTAEAAPRGVWREQGAGGLTTRLCLSHDLGGVFTFPSPGVRPYVRPEPHGAVCPQSTECRKPLTERVWLSCKMERRGGSAAVGPDPPNGTEGSWGWSTDG